jgi:hypothetical protein
MYAAKAGKSTLGIPQKVGADFVKATPKKTRSRMMKSGPKKPMASDAWKSAMDKVGRTGC